MMQPRYRPCGAARASTISNCGPPQLGGWVGDGWMQAPNGMRQTGSCRSCSCRESFSRRLDLELLLLSRLATADRLEEQKRGTGGGEPDRKQ